MCNAFDGDGGHAESLSVRPKRTLDRPSCPFFVEGQVVLPPSERAARVPRRGLLGFVFQPRHPGGCLRGSRHGQACSQRLGNRHAGLPGTAAGGGGRDSATQTPWAVAAHTSCSAVTRAAAAAPTPHLRRGRQRPPAPLPSTTGDRGHHIRMHPPRAAAAARPVAQEPRVTTAGTRADAATRTAAAAASSFPAHQAAAGDKIPHIGRRQRWPPLHKAKVMGGGRSHSFPRTTGGSRRPHPAFSSSAAAAAATPASA